MSTPLRKFQQYHPQLGARVMLDPSAVIIGQVSIDDDCSIWPNSVIRGDMAPISIGKRCSIQDSSVIHISHASQYHPGGCPTIIGDDVTVGHRVMLHGCRIGSRVLIGMSSTIMDGAVVEDEVIIGAGSLVSPHKTLTSGFLYVGSPAKAVRPLKAQEREFLLYSAQNYVKLKDQYLAQLNAKV